MDSWRPASRSTPSSAVIATSLDTNAVDRPTWTVASRPARTARSVLTRFVPFTAKALTELFANRFAVDVEVSTYSVVLVVALSADVKTSS